MSDTPLGVVPIFVNAGAALVPTLIAGVSSFVAILFKPGQLIALVRRKPWLPVPVIAIGVGLWLGIWAMFSTPANAGAKRDRTPRKTDWVAIAERFAREENSGTVVPTTNQTSQSGDSFKKITGAKRLWEYPADEGWVLCRPAVANGKAFAGAAVQDVGSVFGTFFALSATSGEEIWKVDKAGDEDLKPIFSSPAVSEDGRYVIVGQGLHEDSNCALVCFDTATRQLKWKVPTPLHIESSPAIKGDLVVVGAGAIEDNNHKPKGDPGFVLAVRISDGKLLWKHPVADPESCPAISDDGVVYIGSGFNGNAIVALRTETDDELKTKSLKREVWKAPASFPITGPVTLAGDLVLVGGGRSDFVFADPNPAGVVMAINRRDGSIKWQTPMPDSVLNRVAVADGKAYCPVLNGEVVALNIADGGIAWKQAISGKAPIKAGALAVADVVFAASQDGYLAMLGAADGKIIQKHKLNHDTRPGEKGLTVSTPVIAGDKLYVGSETGGLRCFVLSGEK
jgi:outer membrane protein assembly factor BamB